MSAKSEKYKSKKSMMAHEKTEGKMERQMEYGGKKGKMKVTAAQKATKKAPKKK